MFYNRTNMIFLWTINYGQYILILLRRLSYCFHLTNFEIQTSFLVLFLTDAGGDPHLCLNTRVNVSLEKGRFLRAQGAYRGESIDEYHHQVTNTTADIAHAGTSPSGTEILIQLILIFVKLHSNLQTQLNFSWLKKELTLFSHGRKEEEGRNPHLFSSGRNDPTCLNFGDYLVGV